MENANASKRTSILSSLVHNGILIPPSPEYCGMVVTVRGKHIKLDPKQEEMVMAWARKQGTPYVEDGVFVRNFMDDLSSALGVSPPLSAGEVDWSPAVHRVESERAARESRSPEQRKSEAAVRKAKREELRARYGYALVNGERSELGTYMTEPSGIFMGRGKHPLRGRWKEGAQQSDVTLNLSPDAPRPPGDWREIVWQPDGLWVARWKDTLADKTKYIWLADTASAKQEREAHKFDKASELRRRLGQVRDHIEQGLTADDPKRRRIATAVYLIDALGLRVGDEKDPDEADTVGATTLRPEHVTLRPDGVAEFRFLGKDSVLWDKALALPETVQRNLADLMHNARPPRVVNAEKHHPTRDKPQLFPGVSSHDVNVFLGEALPGLTAKVFRTHHATQRVEESLSNSGVTRDDPEHKKWQATTLANVEAASFCNHTKKASEGWRARRDKLVKRQQTAESKLESQRQELARLKAALAELRSQAREARKAAKDKPAASKVAARYEKKTAAMERKLAGTQQRLERQQLALGRLKSQALVAGKTRTWNLTTSLKSYIDPRVFYRWGKGVDYDVLSRYYSSTLQRKFSWVRREDVGQDAATEECQAGV